MDSTSTLTVYVRKYKKGRDKHCTKKNQFGGKKGKRTRELERPGVELDAIFIQSIQGVRI